MGDEEKITVNLDRDTVALLAMAYRWGAMDQRNGDMPVNPDYHASRVLNLVRSLAASNSEGQSDG